MYAIYIQVTGRGKKSDN